MEQGINPRYLSPSEVGVRKSKSEMLIYNFIRILKQVVKIVILLLLVFTNVALVVTAILALLTLNVKSDIISIALVVLILAVLNYTLIVNRRELSGKEFTTRLRR